MKFFLHLSYKGTRFHGWQRQKGVITVQEVLENALEKMVGKRIHCVSCGRTDAGVHASHFFCHIVVDEPFAYDPVFRLNKMLPHDISIFDCIEVPRNAHAQKDAIARTYTYRIHTQKNALLSELSAHYPGEGLEVENLQKAAALLVKYKDYRSMCLQPDLYKSTLCEVTKAEWTTGEEPWLLQFQITADRFLRGMVRILVGTMLEVGYANISVEAFEECLKTHQPVPMYRQAHAQGLYLSGVKYPYF